MKYEGTLPAGKDVDVSRRFCPNVLSRTPFMDLGLHAAFEGFGILKEGKGAEFLANRPTLFSYGNNVCGIVFEDEDIDTFPEVPGYQHTDAAQGIYPGAELNSLL